MNIKAIITKGLKKLVPTKILTKCGMSKNQYTTGRHLQQSISDVLQSGDCKVVNLGITPSGRKSLFDVSSDGIVISRGGITTKAVEQTVMAPSSSRVLTSADAMSKAGIKPTLQETYKEVLEKFRKYKPEVEQYNCYGSSGTQTASHVDGSMSEFSVRIIEKRGHFGQILEEEQDAAFTLISKGKTLGVDLRDFKVSGDEALQKELAEFLGGELPKKENLQAFLEYRDLKHLKEHGFPDFNEFEVQAKSKLKGQEIAKQEGLYHAQRQRMYEGLWKPYHTEPFYRVVGEAELRKVLSGETIVSKNSMGRYGRSCVDITTDPYYHNICYGETKYRITFKTKLNDGNYNDNFLSSVYEHNPENKHFQIPSYSSFDIADIHIWDGENWVELTR